MPLLEVQSTTVRFGVVAALSDVSLTVEAGAVIGVLGPNGSGKTTLLRSIMARVPRASGRLIFDGQDITSLKTAEIVQVGIALCPEDRRLFPNMTIEDNLVLGAYGNSRKVIAERLEQAYEKFAWVGKRRGELAGKLSGGEQQTVAIARSLMAKPKLLLLDEPSSGLSPVAVDEIGSVLATVPDSGTAVMLVEQNVKLVETLCDQAWVLSRGTVHGHGPVGELLAGVSVADAYLGASDIDEQVHDGGQPSRPDERK